MRTPPHSAGPQMQDVGLICSQLGESETRRRFTRYKTRAEALMGRRTGAVMLSSAADIAPAALQCGLLVDWHAAGQGERFIDDSNAFCVCIGDDRRAASEKLLCDGRTGCSGRHSLSDLFIERRTQDEQPRCQMADLMLGNGVFAG